METMELREKIERILQTRKGSRPGNYKYGSRLYLLRDQRFTPTTALMFAKYAKEDIEESDPTIEIKRARLVGVSGDKFDAVIEIESGTLEMSV